MRAFKNAKASQAGTGPAPIKGALVTRDESKRMTAWLQKRGLANHSPWRRRKP